MEVKIDVDETMFKDVIEKELKAFSKEEVHQIVREMIIEYLKTDGVMQSFFLKRNTKVDYYGRNIGDDMIAGPLLVDAVKTMNLSEAFKDVEETMIKEIKDNHKEILEDIMLKTITKALTSDYDFQNTLANSIECILIARNNNNQ